MDPEDLVTCTDCINSKIPSRLCMMDMCMNQKRGYCGGCECECCDSNCLDWDKPKPFKERPKFKVHQ